MVKMLRMRESASTGTRKVEEMLEGLRRAEMEALSAMSRATSFSCSCNTYSLLNYYLKLVSSTLFCEKFRVFVYELNQGNLGVFTVKIALMKSSKVCKCLKGLI
jgi:hypothetical protein